MPPVPPGRPPAAVGAEQVPVAPGALERVAAAARAAAAAAAEAGAALAGAAQRAAAAAEEHTELPSA